MEQDNGYVKRVVRIATFYRLIINTMKLSIVLINGFFICAFVTGLFVGDRSQLIVQLLTMLVVTVIGYCLCNFTNKCVSVSMYSYLDSSVDVAIQEEITVALTRMNYTIN